MAPSFAEVGDLIDLVSGLNRQLERGVSTHLKPVGLSIEQYRILQALGSGEGVTMGELALRAFADGPTMTKIVDRMVASGDVYRAPDPSDRRKVLVLASDKGRELLRRANEGLAALRTEPLERLGRAEAMQLRALLSDLMAER